MERLKQVLSQEVISYAQSNEVDIQAVAKKAINNGYPLGNVFSFSRDNKRYVVEIVKK